MYDRWVQDKEKHLSEQRSAASPRPPLNPPLNGNLNSYLRMKRFFSLFLNIGLPKGRWQVSGPFSTKMSPTSCPGPGGWWLPVVRLSLMHRLLSKHYNPAVNYSMAPSKRTHCAVIHSDGVLSSLAHSVCTPPQHRGLARGRGRATNLDVWSCIPAGNSWWGQCWPAAPRPPLTEHFSSEKYVYIKNIIMFIDIMQIHWVYSEVV